MINTIIFDLDGILADTCNGHYIALNKALKEEINYEISLEDHYMKYNGLPTKVKLAKLTELGICPTNKHKIINEKKQLFTLEFISHELQPDPRKLEMLCFLRDSKYNLGCVTNCSRETATLILHQTELFNYIECLITNEDVNKVKPDCEGFMLCMNKLSALPNSTLIIEDSEQGVEAAKLTRCNLLITNYNDLDLSLLKKYL